VTENGSSRPEQAQPVTPDGTSREITGAGAEVDLDEIMQRVREGVRRRGHVAAPGMAEKHISPFEEGQAAVDLAYLHATYDIQDVGFASHRGILAPVVVAAKKVVRKLLAPILLRQANYNAASTRVITQTKDWVGALQRDHLTEVHAVKRRMDAIEPWVRDEVSGSESRLRRALAAHVQEVRDAQDQAGISHEMASQAEAMASLKRTSAADAERISRVERTVRRLLHALEAGATLGSSPHAPNVDRASASARSGLEPDFDYGGFEERFRGTEVELKERQRGYVALFAGRTNVLDVGCGRGEFLELLRESGIDARGVDLNLDMVLLCKDKGLDVSMADAFAHLESLPDESLGGVFAAQVIEHLHPRRVIELVRLCHRKLEPGAALVLETPNPKCLMVFADSFYKDPSHIQPIHPDTMHFLLEATGFDDVELRFLGAVDPALRIPPLRAPGADLEQFNQGIERLNALLFGFQDYAVIGKKGRASARHLDQ